MPNLEYGYILGIELFPPIVDVCGLIWETSNSKDDFSRRFSSDLEMCNPFSKCCFKHSEPEIKCNEKY